MSNFNYNVSVRYGIDVSILRLVSQLNSKLWNNLGYVAYGSGEIIEEQNSTIPVIYNSGINYTRLFPFPVISEYTEGVPTQINAISFFIPSNVRQSEDIKSIKFNSGCDLYFAIDLSKIYSSITTYRPIENAVNDILKILDSSDFDINEYNLHANAIKDFKFPEQTRKIMHPYLFIKFNLTINY